MSYNKVLLPRKVSLYPFRKAGSNSNRKGNGNGRMPKKERRRRYTRHHMIPVTRVEEFFPPGTYVEKENMIHLPINFHGALHVIIDNLVLSEIFLFFCILYATPGKRWTEAAIVELVEDIKERKYILEGDRYIKKWGKLVGDIANLGPGVYTTFKFFLEIQAA